MVMGGRLYAGEWGRGVGGGWFADLVLVVTEENQTDLTVTNEPSLLPPLTVSSLLKLLYAPSVWRRVLGTVRTPFPFALPMIPHLSKCTFFSTLPFNFLASQLSDSRSI